MSLNQQRQSTEVESMYWLQLEEIICDHTNEWRAIALWRQFPIIVIATSIKPSISNTKQWPVMDDVSSIELRVNVNGLSAVWLNRYFLAQNIKKHHAQVSHSNLQHVNLLLLQGAVVYCLQAWLQYTTIYEKFTAC